MKFINRIIDAIRKSYRLKRVLVPVYKTILRLTHNIKGVFRYLKDKSEYKKKNKRETFVIQSRYNLPIYADRYKKAACLNTYFWQDLWAARLIAINNPSKHYDIGSRVDGFIGHLASFRENVVLIDVRPLEEKIPGIDFIQADATNLEGIPDCSVDSLSALCSLEHFGLGRYGDSVNPEACFEAFKAIVRVMAPGGHAYIAVPIGKEHVEFNAHRVFYASTVIDMFKPMQCVEFSCISEGELGIERDVVVDKYDNDLYVGGKRFGLFHFINEI